MKKVIAAISLGAMVVFASCSKSGNVKEETNDSTNDFSSDQPAKKGVITAAEWNDQNNWTFWTNLLQKNEFSDKPEYWSFYNTNRIAVMVKNDKGEMLSNVFVTLKKGNDPIFTCRTDNFGKAELWPNLFTKTKNIDLSEYSIDVNKGEKVEKNIKSYNDGVNEITLSSKTQGDEIINVSFVVDATGSMGDEINYLKEELNDVLNRVKNENPNSAVSSSAVFYRDNGDEYVTRVSPFTEDVQTTISFINDQKADGGGDIPEAVHTALDKAINELQWTDNAKTKIVFLLLDAPAHHESDVIRDIQNLVSKACHKGIKIIPIVASGADKNAEFLMRFMAISTNGTYVFITDDSGVGNKHMEASVGNYQVEYLNNLMARLINYYAR
jgi:hypothetical protein